MLMFYTVESNDFMQFCDQSCKKFVNLEPIYLENPVFEVFTVWAQSVLLQIFINSDFIISSVVCNLQKPTLRKDGLKVSLVFRAG